MRPVHADAGPRPARPVLTRLAAAPAVVVLLAAGLWFWSGVVAPGYWSSIALGTGWFIAVSVALGKLGKLRPSLRPVLRATYLTCVVASCLGFYWTSIRETEVDEDVVRGTPASELAEPVTVDGADPLAPQP